MRASLRDLLRYAKTGIPASGMRQFEKMLALQFAKKSANLCPISTFSNSNTDTRDFIRPAIRQKNSGSTIKTKNYDDISSDGLVSFTFTVSSEIDQILFMHSGSSRNLNLLVLDINLPTGTYTLSTVITGHDCTVIGGVSGYNVMLNSGSEALPFEPF